MQKCNKELSGGETCHSFFAFFFAVGRMELRYMSCIRGYGATMVSSIDYGVIISFCGLRLADARNLYVICADCCPSGGFQSDTVGV